MNNKKRDELLTKIMAHDFMVIDLQLFLDTHPHDREAIERFNNAVKQASDLHKEYAKNYEPLSRYDSSNSTENYEWVTPVWPWQEEYMQ